MKILLCLQLQQHQVHSLPLVEGDDAFTTLRANHRKLQKDKHREANIITTTARNEMCGAKKNMIAIVALCHIFSCAKAPSCTGK